MNTPGAIFRPVAGLCLDIMDNVRNRPFVPHSLTKIRNIVFCGKATGADTVVEVGSFKGVTARRLGKRFKRVVSVEIMPHLHKQAQETCKGLDNVELILGDAVDLLPKIAKDVDNAILFLDGHFSGGDTGQGDEAEPVLKELDLIRGGIANFKALIVDDFRLFGVEAGWPRKSEVMAKMEEVLPPDHWHHYVLNDQFIALRKAV